MVVTQDQIAAGLRSLGLDSSSAVVVCRASTDTCETVLTTAGTWESTALPPPPGRSSTRRWRRRVRSRSTCRWTPTSAGSRRRSGSRSRTNAAYLATGRHARELIAAQRVGWPLGPLEVLADLGGQVLLLGVGHTSNTAIHLAEQRLGRSFFYRYAKTAPGVWAEFPGLSGESHRFDDLEPALAPKTTEVLIGECRADPRALLCEDSGCERCVDAYGQRLARA